MTRKTRERKEPRRQAGGVFHHFFFFFRMLSCVSFSFDTFEGFVFLLMLSFAFVLSFLSFILWPAGNICCSAALVLQAFHVLHVAHDHEGDLKGDGILKDPKVQASALLELIEAVHQGVTVDVELAAGLGDI